MKVNIGKKLNARPKSVKMPARRGFVMDEEARNKAKAIAAEKALKSLKGAKREHNGARWLSYTGRATRGDWWGINLIVGLLSSIVIGILFGFFVSLEMAGLGFSILVAGSVIGFVLLLPVQVRRLHDLNLSGFFVILIVVLSYIPVINIINSIAWAIILGFLPGTVGRNNYGADPLGRVGNADLEMAALKGIEKKLSAADKQTAALKQKLDVLASLKADGIIDEKEYDEKRRKILDGFVASPDGSAHQQEKQDDRKSARLQKIPVIDFGNLPSPGEDKPKAMT